MIAYAIRAILLASATAAAKMQFRDFGRKAAVLCARQNNGRVAATAVRHNPPAQPHEIPQFGFWPTRNAQTDSGYDGPNDKGNQTKGRCDAANKSSISQGFTQSYCPERLSDFFKRHAVVLTFLHRLAQRIDLRFVRLVCSVGADNRPDKKAKYHDNSAANGFCEPHNLPLYPKHAGCCYSGMGST
jgi:hypothetical protein